jgi:type VI secretion system protein ImpM
MARLAIGYFGKIAARKDFVKAASDRVLANLLDQWLADVMNQLTSNPRWRQHYDALRPLHFAFIGTRNRSAIAGHLAASRDQSDRRFPFLTMSAMRVEDALAFLSCSPLALAPLWELMAALTADAQLASDPATALQRLAGAEVDVDETNGSTENELQAFLAQTTLAGLDAMLGAQYSARRLILALGLLLRPMRTGAGARLEKSLVLPLPPAQRERTLVASLWLALATTFLREVDVELALFFCEREGRHMLAAGFCGASADTLQAVIDPEFAISQQVALDDNDWVEDALATSGEAARLAVCLAQPQLPLDVALRLFRESFS